jgi:IS5 family transposase
MPYRSPALWVGTHALIEPAMEEGVFDNPLYREFTQLQKLIRVPDESSILGFRHRLEKDELAKSGSGHRQ